MALQAGDFHRDGLGLWYVVLEVHPDSYRVRYGDGTEDVVAAWEVELQSGAQS